VADRAHLEQQVAVGDLAALGPPRGARGVDEGGEVVGVHRRAAGLDVVVGQRCAGRDERLDRRLGPVDLPDVRELGQPVVQVVDGGAVLGPLDDHPARPRVGQAPLDLLRRRRLVDGQRGAAGGPEGVVQQRPLVARLRDQPHPVAGLQARGEEALGHGGHLVTERGEAHRRPLAVDAAAVRGVGRVARGVDPQRAGEVLVLGHGGHGRHAVGVHGGSSRPDRRWWTAL